MMRLRRAALLAMALGAGAVLPGAAQREPRRVVVVVGCAKYRGNWDFRTPECPEGGPVLDAKAVRDTLRSAGYEVWLMTDAGLDPDGQSDPDYLPYQRNLEDLLKKWFPAWGYGEADTMLFYFAGHGFQGVDGADYLAPLDAWLPDQPGDPVDRQQLIPVSWVLQTMRETRAGNLLVMLDACRSAETKVRGATAARGDFGQGIGNEVKARGGQGGETLLQREAVLLSCLPGQSSFGDNQGGWFTRYLVGGLSGEADVTGDGLVTVGELDDYLKNSVRDYAKTQKQAQIPQCRPSGKEVYQVVLAGGPTAAPARPAPTPPQPAPPTGGNQRPGNWPSYLNSYTPPAGMSWSSYRVSPKDGMPQALIPAGEFLMGSPTAEQNAAFEQAKAAIGDRAKREWFTCEGPQKRVYVSAFWVDLHEVTNEQYARFVRATGHSAGDAWAKWSRDTSPQHPAVYVNWDDATAYARWAGRELPTEAQWEKAARGGTTTAYPWGAEPNPRLANGDWQNDRSYSAENAVKYCQPVGRYPGNAFGLVDLIGNVWEWCRDGYDGGWYAKMPSRDPVNETQATFRVLRGGSWYLSPDYLRVATRGRGDPGSRFGHLGFRCSAAP